MTELEHSGDHVARAKERLIQQFRGKARIEGLLSAHVDQVQAA